jgi:hypothetical protein
VDGSVQGAVKRNDPLREYRCEDLELGMFVISSKLIPVIIRQRRRWKIPAQRPDLPLAETRIPRCRSGWLDSVCGMRNRKRDEGSGGRRSCVPRCPNRGAIEYLHQRLVTRVVTRNLVGAGEVRALYVLGLLLQREIPLYI